MFVATDRSASNGVAEPSNDDPARRAAPALASHAAEILALFTRLSQLRAARRALWLSRGASLALAGIVLAIVCLTAALAGVRLGVRGLTGAFGSAFGERTWLAELSSGLVLLCGTAVLLGAARAGAERRILRYLRRHRERRNAAP
jgi:hypothetical protein